MHRFIAAVAICVLAITSAACNKETPVSIGKSTGDLSGTVELLDYSVGTPDNSGVNVTVEGTNYKAVTDASGMWTIHLLPAGTYNLKFSKEGYSTYKVFGQQIVGEGVAYLPKQVRLARVPTEFTMSNFRIDSVTRSYIVWSGNLQPGVSSLPDGYVSLGVVFAKDSTLLNDTTMFTNPGQVWSEKRFLVGDANQNTRAYSAIPYSGVKSGDRLYVASYVGWADNHDQIPDRLGYTYYDPTRGRIVNPAIRSLHSNVVSFVVP